MSEFSSYFDASFQHIREKKPFDIKPLLKDEMFLIGGDFYGIQKFIFERLNTKNASKVIRAKSAFIQLFTITLARFICKKLNISESHIITTNAGKFEILSPARDESVLKQIQKVVDNYFLTNFYGLSGASISWVTCSDQDFKDKFKYKKLRENIGLLVEQKKFNKFNLIEQPSFMQYDMHITNDSLCKICNIRKIHYDHCDICNTFIRLGKDLVSDKQSVSSKKDLSIDLEGFDTEITLNEKIKSYVKKGEYDEPVDFEKLAKNSCKEIETGIKALGILKADVDGMGNFIKNSDVAESFENFNLFSKTLDNFFSLYIPTLMKEKYPDTYTVFAGGDDLFLVGSWDVLLQLAREIREKFKTFVKDPKLSISFGMAVAKASTPISYLAHYTEHALEEAKAIDDKKDAITLFRETVKWESYLSTIEKLEKTLNKINKEDIKTAFLYSILEFCEMSKKVKYENDIPSTMWKSKLRYSFTRNMDKKYWDILETLNECIDKHPKESKMFLSEFIYKRRD